MNPTLMTTTATLSEAEPSVPLAAERAALIGNRKTITEIAAAFGCTERTVYTVIADAKIPYVKVFGRRFIEAEKFRQAISSMERGGEPATRGRGRPRKAA